MIFTYIKLIFVPFFSSIFFPIVAYFIGKSITGTEECRMMSDIEAYAPIAGSTLGLVLCFSMLSSLRERGSIEKIIFSLYNVIIHTLFGYWIYNLLLTVMC